MPTEKMVSVVIPCYNEEKNVERFPSELLSILDSFGIKYEVIAVDDCSKDDTWGALVKLAKQYPQFKALKHSRNYGQGAAYQTGFDYSKGEYVLTFAPDLESSAQHLKRIIELLEEGYDLVNTNRVSRWTKSGLLGLARRVPSNLANSLIAKISGVQIKDSGSGMKGFKKFIIENLKIYGDMHRFLPAYSSLYTTKIIEFDVEYKDRTYGKSASSPLGRTFKVFLDLFSMKFMLSFATKPFSMMPGRIFGSCGLASFFIGLLITGYLVVLKLGFGQDIGNRPLLIGGVLMIIFGVQLVMTGLLGELLMRIYFEGSGRKPYTVSEIVE